MEVTGKIPEAGGQEWKVVSSRRLHAKRRTKIPHFKRVGVPPCWRTAAGSRGLSVWLSPHWHRVPIILFGGLGQQKLDAQPAGWEGHRCIRGNLRAGPRGQTQGRSLCTVLPNLLQCPRRSDFLRFAKYYSKRRKKIRKCTMTAHWARRSFMRQSGPLGGHKFPKSLSWFLVEKRKNTSSWSISSSKMGLRSRSQSGCPRDGVQRMARDGALPGLCSPGSRVQQASHSGEVRVRMKKRNQIKK